MISGPVPFKKTRIAPTPSGYLHLGNALSFALTAGLALDYRADILLRIDDLDRARVQKPYIQDIFDTLDFLGIRWQEGPQGIGDLEQRYSQLHRLELYKRALNILKERGLLFACECSRSILASENPGSGYPGTCRYKAIPLDRPGTCLRLDTGSVETIRMRSLSGYLSYPFPESMRYFIVWKKDGFPAYQLSSLADDLHFGIDLIVRGADLFPSTLAQLYLAQLLTAEPFLQSTFCHHPLLQAGPGLKLSKSGGATSIQFLRHSGQTPGAIYTEIARQLGLAETAGNWQQLYDAVRTHGIL